MALSGEIGEAAHHRGGGGRMSILFWRGRVSKAEFRRQYMAYVRERLPDHPCEEVAGDDLSLKVSGFPQHAEVTQCLDNVYAEFRKNPQDRDDIFERALSLLRSLGHPAVPDRSNILPMLKSRQWLANCYPAGHAPEANSGAELHHEVLNDELVVTYVTMEPAIRFVQRADIADAGILPAELRGVALTNMRARLPRVEFVELESVWSASVGGNFEATMLVDEEIWRDERFAQAETVLVAVPDRNTILMSTDASVRGVWTMSSFAAVLARTETYPISSHVFRRVGTEFEPLDRGLEDLDHPIPRPEVYDVILDVEDAGPRAAIVIATPLDGSPRSVHRLFRKLESYLVSLGCDGSRAKQAVPEDKRPQIYITIHQDSHPELLDILQGMASVVSDRGANLRLEVKEA
jgi:hypothetical protein